MKFINDVNVQEYETSLDELGLLANVSSDAFKPLNMLTNRTNTVRGYYCCDDRVSVACINGTIKLVLFDLNPKSSTEHDTNEFFMGETKPLLISMPKNVAFCWQCISSIDAIVVTTMKNYNCVIDPHSEEKQVEQLGFAIPYTF